jgi:hypothetical protein
MFFLQVQSNIVVVYSSQRCVVVCSRRSVMFPLRGVIICDHLQLRTTLTSIVTTKIIHARLTHTAMTTFSRGVQADIILLVIMVGVCAKVGIAFNPIEMQVTSCLGNSSTSDTTSTQNCSSIASSLTWWNMSRLGAIEITERAFVVPLPDNFPQVSLFHMWLAAASCHYKKTERNNTVQYYKSVTRVPLYLNAFGGVTVVPQEYFDTLLTQGVAIVAPRDLSNASVRAALAPPNFGGDILLEYTKGMGCDCGRTNSHCGTASCSIAFQTRIGRYGDQIGIVVKNVDSEFVTNTGTVSVGLAPSQLYPLFSTVINGTLGDQLHVASSAADTITGARYVSFQYDETLTDVCLAATTCEECLALTLPEGTRVPCSFAHNFNTHGVCLPSQIVSDIEVTARNAHRFVDCVTFANVSMFGPCFRSKQSCAVQHSTPNGIEAVRSEVEGHSSQSPTMLTYQQSLDLGRVTGCAPSHMPANTTCPASVLALRVACPTPYELTVSFFPTDGSDASSAILHVPLRCTEVALSWRMHNLTNSRWCLPPYVHGRYCNVTTLVATVMPFTYVAQYFHRSGVVAVHALAQSGINVSNIMSPTFLESVSSEVVQSSRYLLWAPNRSTYFVSGYSCLVECVHGTCDESGSCICTNPTQWTGPSCDIPAGIFYVNSVNTSRGVSAECPICAHGNCSNSGMCICDEGHGGPRCELNCNTAPRYTCPAVMSLAVCATCACFAGTSSNASYPVCFPLVGCTFSNITGTLLSTTTCPDASTSNGPTRSPTAAPPQPRTAQQTSSPWTRTNALAVILALCVSAVLLSVFMQLLSFRRRARRAGKVRTASNAGPMEGVRHLLPAPQLVSP